MRLIITDNAYRDRHEGWPLDDCIASKNSSQLEEEQIIRDLNIIGGRNLDELIEDNPNLLVFPQSFDIRNDDIGKMRICSYDSARVRLYTGNLMGFVGVNDTQLTIKSRFSGGEEDFFLHYMLWRVFCPNILKLQHGSSSDSIFDFLIYLFPKFFNDAMRQGLFKEYQRFRRNDSNVKGTIDVARHISANMPFGGKIAYTAREYSYDNHITQLVRHTIEFIKRSSIGKFILDDKETRQNVKILCEATQSYSRSDLGKVLIDNKKGLSHPYFEKYIPLQKLCVNILKRHKLKYGSEKDKIYGILFDGAWLWEEFLNTIFVEWGLHHAENKTGKNPIFLFEGNSYIRYPDFFKENQTVIDAKYKRIGFGDIARDDIHQIITYMHVLNARSAFVAYPKSYGESSIDVIGILNGLKGEVGTIGLKIPTAESFHDFQRQIDDEIAKLTALWKSYEKSNESIN